MSFSERDMISKIEFHPIKKDQGTRTHILKTFSLKAFEKVFDRETKYMENCRYELSKNPELRYRVVHLPDRIILECAIDEESLGEFKLEIFEMEDIQ